MKPKSIKKELPGLIHHMVEIPMYHGEFHMIYAKDMNDAIAKFDMNIKNRDMNDYSAFVHVKPREDRYTRYFLVMGLNTSYSVIVHEIVHVKNAVFIDRDIELDIRNDEPEAYFSGWLVKQVHDFIFKNQIKLQ